MSYPRRPAIRILVLAAVCTMGCGKQEQNATSSPAAAPVRKISAADLPGLGEYEPPIDEGRIEVAAPEGWTVGSRSKGYAIRFLAPGGRPYPMILLKSEPAAGAPATTAESVVAFAKDAVPDGTAKPIALGPHYGAIYLKRGKDPNSIDQILERLLFQMVAADRVFTFELRVRQGQVREHQSQLFAVVAGMKLPGAAVESPPIEEPPPTEERPAPETPAPETEESPEEPATEVSDPELEGLDDLFQ